MNGSNLHELPQGEFDRVADRLEEAGIHIPEFGSLIGNRGKKTGTNFEIARVIPRIQWFGTPLIRNYPHPVQAEPEGVSDPFSRTS